jgi:ATP/maltotriose-dependent transcriptional regulator MalT
VGTRLRPCPRKAVVVLYPDRTPLAAGTTSWTSTQDEPDGLAGPGGLLGRDDELRLIDEHADVATAGRGQVVLLRGPSGIGKTQLLRSAVIRLTDRGLRVLEASCGELTSGSGYEGVRELFTAIDQDDLRGAARWARSALAPGDDQPAGGYAVLHGLYWLAVGLMSEEPLVLVLDDVHWCDENTLRWLDFLMRRAENLPLLVLLAQRTGEGSDLLAQLTRHEYCASVEVRPLVGDAVVDLIIAELDEVPAPAFAARCTRVSGGNPLLLGRLLTELRRVGVRPDAESVGMVSELGRDVLAASVLTALSGQPDYVTKVARAAAVVGTGKPSLLAAMCQVPSRSVAAALRELVRGDMLDERGEFAHDQVRSTILTDMPAAELHAARASAARLLNDEGEPAELVAGHLLRTPVDEPWMLAVLRDAAARAERRGVPEAAVGYLRRALTSTWLDDATRVRLRIDLASLLTQIDPTSALVALREVLGLIPDPRTRTPIAALFGRAALATQRSPEAVELMVQVIDDLEHAPGAPAPGDAELRTLAEASLLIVGADEVSTLPLVTARARDLPEPDGHTEAERTMLTMKALLTGMSCGSVEECVRLARKAVSTADVPLAGWTLLGSALALGLAGRNEDSLVGLDRTLVETRKRTEPIMHMLALSARSALLRQRGDLADAAADAQTAGELAVQELAGLDLTMPLIAQASISCDLGEPRRAADLLSQLSRERFDQFVWEWHSYVLVKARVRHQLGDAEGALATLLACDRSLTAAGVTNPMYAPWWPQAVDLLVELGRRGEALDLVDRINDDVRRWPIPRAVALARLAAGVAADKPEHAVHELTEAIELLDGCWARPDRILAGHRLGQVLLDLGEAKQARRVLRAAMDLATSSGEKARLTQISRLVVRAGGRIRRQAGQPLDALTGSERRVITMAAAGESNRAIAEALFVTLRTVELHLTSAYRKLGVSGRSELTSVPRVRR